MTASQFIRSGQYHLALLKINEELLAHPYNEGHLFTKATILYHLERYAEADEIYNELYKTNKNSSKLLYSMALSSLAKGNTKKAFYLLELSYQKGSSEGIYKIIELLFERKGICDFENCTACCCKNMVLKGTDGKTVSDKEGFLMLTSNPNENSGWEKVGENKKKEWIFDCKHLIEKNACSIYLQRPLVCKDFPSSILSLKKECSYTFELKPDTERIKSGKTLLILLDILEAYNYHKEIDIFKAQYIR